MVIVPGFERPTELVTLIPNVKVPLFVGVPVINPVRVLRDSPGGNVPLTMKNRVGELVASIVWLKNAPIVPEREAEITLGTERSVMVNLMLPAGDVPPALLAVIPTVKLPTVVGVPLINPVEVFKVRPTGSAPLAMAKLVGELVAMIWRDNAEFFIPVIVASVTTGIGGKLIVMVSVASDDWPPALLALIPRGNAPVVVGVPLITPEAAFKVRPGGKVPLVTEYPVGELVATIW